MHDPLLLSRLQFAGNISFHILFPTINLALAWVLVFFKLRHNRSQDDKWLAAYGFWVKVFALTFALGVVSGITMSFQFGTNWPGFMETVGNVAGPLLAYEVLTAFFMEASFLGIMLFGKRYVTNRVHTLATVLVAIGTSLSAFWILALNSWMHTPTGFIMIDGVAHASNWLEIIFNPSFPYRLLHMLVASGLTVAFLLAGLSAYRLLQGDPQRSTFTVLRSGVLLAALLAPLQILIGDLHGLNTLEHQPQKVAAMEGVWETQTGAPLLLFALPNEAKRSNDHVVAIPKGASWILTHDAEGEIKGLNDFDHHPPVLPVFFAFRIMVGIGILMLLLSWSTAWQIRRNAAPNKFSLQLLLAMTFSGWVATLCGWYVTEIGRQPFLVSGILKTADAVSATDPGLVLSSLIMYSLLYVFLLVSFIYTLFYLAKKSIHAPGVPS